MTPLEILQLHLGKEFKSTPSPFTKWLDPVVLVAEEAHIEFQYMVRAEWLNPIGNIHGGITAAIIDDVIGATVFTLNEPFFYTTINNVIDYFSVAKENEYIIADTRIIKRGKQFINAQCDIWNGNKSRLIAKGYSNLFKTTVHR